MSKIEPHAITLATGERIEGRQVVLAVEGGAVKCPTVERPVMITVPAGSTSGKTLRLKGKDRKSTRLNSSHRT